MDSLYIIAHDAQVIERGPGGHVLDFCGPKVADCTPCGRVKITGQDRPLYHVNLTRPHQADRAGLTAQATTHCGCLVYDSWADLIAAHPVQFDKVKDKETNEWINVPQTFPVAEK